MMILLWLVGCRYSVVDVQRRMYERRLDNRMERLGEDHPKTLDTMNSLAIAYEQSGQFAKAESLYLEAYQRSLSVLGAEHPDTVIGLENLSFFYEDREQFTEAEPLNRRLYEVYLRHLGPEHPETIFILHNLAYLNELLEDYTEAESLYQDALVKHRQVYGDNHVETIEVMANLGDLQNFLGKYDQAIETYLQQRKALLVLYGKDSAEVLWIHSRLAMVYAEQGRYSDAEQEYTFLLDPTHRGILSPREQLRLRSNLALVYKNQGRFDRWLSQTELIVEISKEVLEEDDYAVYIVQNNLAHVYLAEKRYEDAEQVVLKALQQSRQSLGVNASPTMSLLETLGEIYSVQRRHDQAIAIRQELYEHAKTIYGIGHPDTIRLANNLATVLFEHDQVDQAETLLLESVEAIGQLWGDSTSINQAYTLLSNLVGVYHHKEKWDKMLASMRLQLEGEEEFLRANLFGAEETLRGVTAIIRESADFVYYAALEVYPSEFQYQSARLAMETSLRRKGRIMQSQVQMLASNQQSALHQERILDLQQLRRQEAGLVQNSDPNDLLKTQQQLRRLRDQIQKVEQELSFQHKDLYSLLQPPMIEDVIRAMPEESLFLDFVLYDNDEETIGVFALNKQGEIKSARIDSVDSLQKQLQVFRQTRSATFGKMLYQKLIASIVPDLSRYQYLFISPDGPLSLIPFEILEDPNGEMVIDKIKVSYQSTGRDLVGLPKNSSPEVLEPFVLANPTYSSTDNQMSLPATQAEADLLKRLYPRANVFTEKQATVERLREVDSPRFLHIATHGFFDADDPNTNVDDNPMTRSGLILAGSDNEEGATRMLASEVATLDLDGTELVVLSACESGLGKAENGEGVYGLRRALALAGAQSQVVSLWSVDDDATAYFMESFYTKLKEGKGKAEAMKETKLEMRSTEMWENPKYWAAFVLTGDWR